LTLFFHRVAERISHRLADDRDGPAITASIGVAEYPNDGLDKGSLITAADIILYKIKSRNHIIAPSGE
jgi:GGDEF domain-containing protein